MKRIKENLVKLCSATSVGNIHEASDIAAELLGEYAQVKKSDKNLTVNAFLKGEQDYTLMVEAHIDQIAFVVTATDENGFLSVAKCGGFDIRILPATRVIIHGKKKIKGVFCSTPPHLSSKEKEKEYTDISELKIDSCLGKNVADYISVGDYVTYDFTPAELLNNRIASGSLDNRAGCVCVIELARRLQGKKLPFNVLFTLADGEELGNRGSVIAAFEACPDEAIAIDVSFGTAPDVLGTEGGVLGKGAMIGVSPVLNSSVCKRLEGIAKDSHIPYQLEIMGGKTSTDGDMISISGKGVKTGLLSIPLRNMHTPVEVLDMSDIVSICDILEKYILAGGVLGD